MHWNFIKWGKLQIFVLLLGSLCSWLVGNLWLVTCRILVLYNLTPLSILLNLVQWCIWKGLSPDKTRKEFSRYILNLYRLYTVTSYPQVSCTNCLLICTLYIFQVNYFCTSILKDNPYNRMKKKYITYSTYLYNNVWTFLNIHMLSQTNYSTSRMCVYIY